VGHITVGGDTIRYWEPQRILYNGVLLLVVATRYWANLPASRAVANADSLQVLFVLAVLANVAYCAAYIVDVVVQMSAFAVNGCVYAGCFLALVCCSRECSLTSSRADCLLIRPEPRCESTLAHGTNTFAANCGHFAILPSFPRSPKNSSI
jgi:hypothetical protein